MYKVFQYRLYPTRRQAQLMDSQRETCRRWYNRCLDERKVAYQEHGQRITLADQVNAVKAYRAANPWAAEVPSQVLQNVVQQLERSFDGFFRRIKAGQKAGYPRFKSRNRFKSFGYKQYGNGFKIDGRRLRLSHIGRIAVRWHRPIQGRIKTLQIVQKAGKWSACFACEVESQPLPQTSQEIGIDVGIASVLTTSDGQHIANPRWFHREERNLRVLQRRVSRPKRGGSNRRKTVRQLQRQYLRVTHRRKDFLNKLVYALIQRYDRIVVEDLRIRYLVRNHRLSKSILDSSWGYLLQHLSRKAEEAGRQVCVVDSRYTSKMCSGCGRIFENLTLKDRWVQCVCGLSFDRDHNAALNILKRAGQVRWASSLSLDEFAHEPASL